MIQSEAQLEQQFIEKLRVDLNYKYLDYIHDLDSLNRNFRKHFQRLNYVTLSDDEFEKLLKDNISPDVFTVSKHLREKQTFVRNDGTSFDYSLVNLRDWCKNEFEVVSQVSLNTANSHHRYDVIILINGLPLVQIELKRYKVSPLKAIEQIMRYKQDPGNSFTNSLMCFMQLFIVSNGVTDTMYFANNNDEHFQFDTNNNYLPVYHAANRDNEKVAQLFEFADMMLQKCALAKLISRYMVLVETEKKILVMRPYQIYAVEDIIECVKQNLHNGYIWHTTGSGKTLTSFKASTLLKDNADIEKCVFVVDRKDLDKQTRDEFNKFQEGCVEQNANTAALVSRLESDDYADKVIVTTIQKLGVALRSSRDKYINRLERLRNQRIVFIFDECHRGQFSKNHKAIKEFFPNAQLFGFTGTPIFEENSRTICVNGDVAENMTTKDVFDESLHEYTITNAIKDENVLGFKMEYYKNTDANGVASTQPISVNQVVKHILDNHDKYTAKRRFNALLATPSIPDAIRYFEVFKQEQAKRVQEDPDFEPLNITAVFTPPMSRQQDEEDLPQEADDNQKTPDENKSALSEIISQYNAQFDTNFSVELFDEYYRDVQQRIKFQKYPNKDYAHKNKLDVIIVVEMMLTGFDSKFLNTLYVAKDLRYHGLIQAFSRTNRILDGTKPHGNIICFRNLESAMDQAMRLFSGIEGKTCKEYWLVDSAATVFEQYKGAIDHLQVVMGDMGLACKPEEVINIPPGEGASRFVDAFKHVQRYALKLDQYADLEPEQKAQIEAAMPEETLQQFRTAYLDLARRTRTVEPGTRTEILVDDNIDYEFSLFSSAIVDYDYIMRLMSRYTEDRVKITKEQILALLSSNSDLINEREYLRAFINEELHKGKVIKENEIRRLYDEFKENRIKGQIAEIAQKYSLDAIALENFVQETTRLLRIDENTFADLLSHIDNWKLRKAAKEGLVADLQQIFILLTGGEIIDLSAYLKQ